MSEVWLTSMRLIWNVRSLTYKHELDVDMEYQKFDLQAWGWYGMSEVWLTSMRLIWNVRSLTYKHEVKWNVRSLTYKHKVNMECQKVVWEVVAHHGWPEVVSQMFICPCSTLEMCTGHLHPLKWQNLYWKFTKILTHSICVVRPWPWRYDP